MEVLASEPGRLWRGGRVFGLEAIAAALRSHPGIADAAVTVRTDEDGEARPIACLVPARGAGYTETELRQRVREVLPESAVPRHFVEVDGLARDADGAPRWDRLAIAAPWEAVKPAALPATPTEQYVAALWQELLGTPSPHSTDKFFDLGGHSLLCFRFIDRVTRERGVRVNPRVVLLGTLEQVAAEIDVSDHARRSAVRGGESTTAAAATSGGVFGRIKRMLGGAA